MDDWQPIDTAPKNTAIWLVVDGECYIGYCDPARPCLQDDDVWITKACVRRRDDAADEICGCYGHHVSPTHWMPLPEPPKPLNLGPSVSTGK